MQLHLTDFSINKNDFTCMIGRSITYYKLCYRISTDSGDDNSPIEIVFRMWAQTCRFLLVGRMLNHSAYTDALSSHYFSKDFFFCLAPSQF